MIRRLNAENETTEGERPAARLRAVSSPRSWGVPCDWTARMRRQHVRDPCLEPLCEGRRASETGGARLWRNAARIMYLRAGYIQSCFTIGPVACSRDRRRSIIPTQRRSVESVDHPTRADDRSQSAIVIGAIIRRDLRWSLDWFAEEIRISAILMVSQNALEDNYSSCDKTATSIPSRFDINQQRTHQTRSIAVNRD